MVVMMGAAYLLCPSDHTMFSDSGILARLIMWNCFCTSSGATTNIGVMEELPTFKVILLASTTVAVWLDRRQTLAPFVGGARHAELDRAEACLHTALMFLVKRE